MKSQPAMAHSAADYEVATGLTEVMLVELRAWLSYGEHPPFPTHYPLTPRKLRTMPDYPKPLPYPSPETQPFWEACRRHELSLPYCPSCEQFFFYPRQFCPRCFSWDIEWRACSGRGTLYTFAIQFRPQVPGFTPPYVTAIVQLDEGPRLMTNLIDVEPSPDDIVCDMPLEVAWQDATDEITLPLFRPAK